MYKFQLILTGKKGEDVPSILHEISGKIAEPWAIKQAQSYFRKWVIQNKKSGFGWRFSILNHPKYGKFIPAKNAFEFALDNHGLRHK